MYNKIINITLSIIDKILVPKRIKVIGLYFFLYVLEILGHKRCVRNCDILSNLTALLW